MDSNPYCVIACDAVVCPFACLLGEWRVTVPVVDVPAACLFVRCKLYRCPREKRLFVGYVPIPAKKSHKTRKRRHQQTKIIPSLLSTMNDNNDDTMRMNRLLSLLLFPQQQQQQQGEEGNHDHLDDDDLDTLQNYVEDWYQEKRRGRGEPTFTDLCEKIQQNDPHFTDFDVIIRLNNATAQQLGNVLVGNVHLQQMTVRMGPDWTNSQPLVQGILQSNIKRLLVEGERPLNMA